MKAMKKAMSIVLAAVLCLVCFAGCKKSEGSDGQTLIIGGSGPLTGDAASYGISVQQGAELAIEEINAAGGVNGIKFELEFEDDVNDAATAVQAYATLYDEGMKVSLGTVTSTPCVAVTEEVKKDGMLMLTPTGSQKECTQYDNCFRVCFMDPDQGTYAAQFIADHNVGSKIAVLYDKSSDYSSGIYENFKTKAQELNLEIVTEQAFTDQSKTDFSVQLQAIKSSGADLLFMPFYYQEAALVITQAADAGLDVTFFGVDGMDGIIAQMGEAKAELTEGIILLTPFVANSTDEKISSFVEAYEKAYDATPDQFAADAYDAIYIIKAAMEEAAIEDVEDKELNEKLIAAMTEIEVDGVTGKMTWSADGEPTKSAQAVVIQDGVYVEY
jgi:branched-chain amino acid transport system substrate-binding protein